MKLDLFPDSFQLLSSGSITIGNLPADCELASQKDSCAVELEFKKCVNFVVRCPTQQC